MQPLRKAGLTKKHVNSNLILASPYQLLFLPWNCDTKITAYYFIAYLKMTTAISLSPWKKPLYGMGIFDIRLCNKSSSKSVLEVQK